MHSKHVNQTYCKWLSGSETSFLAGKFGKIPSPTGVEGIRLNIKNGVNNIWVWRGWIAVPKEFLCRENSRATFPDTPQTRPSFVAFAVK